MEKIKRYIKKLSKNITISQSNVVGSPSEYYKLDNFFKIRLSNHMLPNSATCDINIISVYDNPDTFIVSFKDSRIPIILKRKDVLTHIKTLYNVAKIHHIPVEMKQKELAAKTENEQKLSSTEKKICNAYKEKRVPYRYFRSIALTKLMNDIDNNVEVPANQIMKAVSDILKIQELDLSEGFNENNVKVLKRVKALHLCDYTDKEIKTIKKYTKVPKSLKKTIHITKAITLLILLRQRYIQKNKPDIHTFINHVNLFPQESLIHQDSIRTLLKKYFSK